jgi:hypothetical protein
VLGLHTVRFGRGAIYQARCGSRKQCQRREAVRLLSSDRANHRAAGDPSERHPQSDHPRRYHANEAQAYDEPHKLVCQTEIKVLVQRDAEHDPLGERTEIPPADVADNPAGVLVEVM